MITEAEVKAVISELNRIEVKGEQNMDILLGCISFLKMKLKHKDDPKDIPVVTESTPIEVNADGR